MRRIATRPRAATRDSRRATTRWRRQSHHHASHQRSSAQSGVWCLRRRHHYMRHRVVSTTTPPPPPPPPPATATRFRRRHHLHRSATASTAARHRQCRSLHRRLSWAKLVLEGPLADAGLVVATIAVRTLVPATKDFLQQRRQRADLEEEPMVVPDSGPSPLRLVPRITLLIFSSSRRGALSRSARHSRRFCVHGLYCSLDA